jgi:hypothetical protein
MGNPVGKMGIRPPATLSFWATNTAVSESHPANALAPGICNVKVAILIETDAERAIQLSALSWTTISAETSYTVPRNHLDNSRAKIQASKGQVEKQDGQSYGKIEAPDAHRKVTLGGCSFS